STSSGTPRERGCMDLFKLVRSLHEDRLREAEKKRQFSAPIVYERRNSMSRWMPDPSFYPSPQMAMQAPSERYAYVAAMNYGNNKPDGISVVDLDASSPTFSQIVHTLALPYVGDELHHFGWNACSSALCPTAPHPHLER